MNCDGILHYVADLFSVLQGVAECCRVLHMSTPETEARRKDLAWIKEDHMRRCVAVCCSVLQCVAVCCSVMQYVAVCCRVSECDSV